MTGVMENLYYGNIMPYDQTIRRGSEIDKALKQVVECEEQLNSRLHDEEKSIFERYDNAKSKLLTLTACEHWGQGFSLGLKVGIEAMETVERLTA